MQNDVDHYRLLITIPRQPRNPGGSLRSLRSLLKVLWRRWKVRCIEVQQIVRDDS